MSSNAKLTGTLAGTLAGTIAGSIAIIMWGTLGILASLSSSLPPYLVLALCFSIAGAIGTVLCLVKGLRPAPFFKPSMLLYMTLLSLYHLTYLEAFHYTAALPVSLINYLWPALFIVIGNIWFNLGSGWRGIAGTGIGFSGILILISDGAGLKSADYYGYGLALFGALLWALYSNLRRRDTSTVISSMTTLCLGSALICFVATFSSLKQIPVLAPGDWAVIVTLGLGPAGGAFFLWDYGLKNGNAVLLSILGYSAPLVSSLLMIALGIATFSWSVAAAALLIAAGGVVCTYRPKPIALNPGPQPENSI